MIDKEKLLNDKEFYKSFKNGSDLTQLAVQMLKNAVIVLKFHSKQPIFGYKSAETLVFG